MRTSLRESTAGSVEAIFFNAQYKLTYVGLIPI